jgi:hypothetical protein
MSRGVGVQLSFLMTDFSALLLHEVTRHRVTHHDMRLQVQLIEPTIRWYRYLPSSFRK